MLEYSQTLTYVLALAIAAAIPGPGMIALLAKSLNEGVYSGFSLLTGIILGDLIYLSFAVFGLSFIAENFHFLFIFIKWGAALYLIFLAYLFWKTKPQAINIEQNITRKSLISSSLTGLSITLGNPKTIAFYLALLPTVIQLDAISLVSWITVLTPLTAITLFTIGSFFILFAVVIRHRLSSPKAQSFIFRGAALAMFFAAGALATKEA